jgi:hypothetical protein
MDSEGKFTIVTTTEVDTHNELHERRPLGRSESLLMGPAANLNRSRI